MKKYDPELLTFNEANHGHYYDGKRLTGVTTALGVVSKGDALVQWAANQAIEYVRQNAVGELSDSDLAEILRRARFRWREVKKEAADVGTQAHAWVEAYLKGQNPEPPTNPQVLNSCNAAKKWIEQHDWQTIEIEKQVYLPDLGVAGICDWFARIDGVLAVPDWKTSKSLYSTYCYQTAAYTKALEAYYDVKIPHRWLLRLDKETGEFQDVLLPRKTLARDFRAFKDAVGLYRTEQELRRLGQDE